MSGRGQRRIAAFAIAALGAILTTACGSDGPTGPTPPPPIVQPSNSAPVVESISASASRIEVGTEVTLTATVRDVETAIEQLAFEWRTDGGTFTGQGVSVRWSPPADRATPADYTFTLVVTETYGFADQSGLRPKHTVTTTGPVVRVHDSRRELADLATAFLTDFSNSSVPAETCVRNFSDSCQGKRAELEDIANNRAQFTIVDARYSVRSATVSSDLMRGDIIAPCEFTSIAKSNNQRGTVRGDCVMTAVYEQGRWWLCDSRFFGSVVGVFRSFFDAQ